MVNKSSGNMYKNVQTWNPLGGKCSHDCIYCYVKANRWPSTKEKYSGNPRLYPNTFKSLGTGKTIFVCNMTDLFAEDIPGKYITEILEHCHKYDNTYIFQTKNPNRLWEWIIGLPEKSILICTIESDIDHGYCMAPSANNRAYHMIRLRKHFKGQMGITIEPIQKFDLANFLYILEWINPDFVYIGADSKGHNLKEPTYAEVDALIGGLKKAGIEIKIKDNLYRLYKPNFNKFDIAELGKQK